MLVKGAPDVRNQVKYIIDINSGLKFIVKLIFGMDVTILESMCPRNYKEKHVL